MVWETASFSATEAPVHAEKDKLGFCWFNFTGCDCWLLGNIWTMLNLDLILCWGWVPFTVTSVHCDCPTITNSFSYDHGPLLLNHQVQYCVVSHGELSLLLFSWRNNTKSPSWILDFLAFAFTSAYVFMLDFASTSLCLTSKSSSPLLNWGILRHIFLPLKSKE